MIRTFCLPYTRILIKPSEASPERTFILRPMLSVWLSHEEKNIHCRAGFSTAMDLVKFGLLGRYGFFDLFKQVSFDSENSLVEIAADL